MTRSLGHLSALSTSLMTEPGCSHFTWTHAAAHLEPARSQALHVLLLVDETGASTVISDAPFSELTVNDRSGLRAMAEKHGLSVINLEEPLPLTPVHIAKPWGQEIWYSGIEARGVSLVGGTSIAWLLDVFGPFLGCEKAPLLLKILDPLPTENLGDLYFEMHEQKIEVYVVTSIDQNAWPDGTGAIRYGFNPQKLAEYNSREAFLTAYVEQVSNYQDCRNEIDGLIENRADSIPETLQEKEKRLREAMYAFTELKPLKTGDVVTVRPLVPHSLQHGVRVVEFQTPHYERYILSFGQKVLTQDHWDTSEVFDKAMTEPVEFDPPKPLGDNQDLVADFDEFKVTRIQIATGESVTLENDQYTLLMGIQGDLQFDTGVTLQPETAFFVPHKKRVSLSNKTESPAIVLVAEEASSD